MTDDPRRPSAALERVPVGRRRLMALALGALFVGLCLFGELLTGVSFAWAVFITLVVAYRPSRVLLAAHWGWAILGCAVGFVGLIGVVAVYILVTDPGARMMLM